MDLINLRQILNTNINDLLEYTLKLQEEYENYKKQNATLSSDFNKSLQELTKEIKDKTQQLNEKDLYIEKITRDFNKTKTDYEKIINDSNQKIDELQKEEDDKNRHDMIKSQAKLLDEKERVIEILQNKLLKLTNKQKETKVEEKLTSLLNETSTQETLSNKTIVFTDGACSDNGTSFAKAGIGVYFGDEDVRNVSKRISGKQTNNAAELSAILEVFDICKKELDNGDEIVIYSDSDYAIKSFTTRGDSYKNKGWKKYNGTEIENVELVKKGHELFKKYPNVSINHVKAHTGKKDLLSLGNEMADKLATQSLEQPDINEQQEQDEQENLEQQEPDEQEPDKQENLEQEEPEQQEQDEQEPDEQKPEQQEEPEQQEPDEQENLEQEEPEQQSDESEDDEILLRIKHKKVYYYIVKDENPQYIYNIVEEGIKGERVGERTIKDGKKRYNMY
jgi:ribonuclease HI